MTDPGLSLYHWDDAQLLNLVRAGNAEAFEVIWQRHVSAARKLAGLLVSSSAEADDAVAEAFERVLEVTNRGGGPSHAVRPYVLNALRRVCQDRQSSQPGLLLQDAQQQADLGAPLVDPDVAGVEQTLVAHAYLALPERWRAVLWHAEIEQAHPLVISPLLGLARDGIAALKGHAIDDLRQVCLQMYGASIANHDCASVSERLGDYMREALPLPEEALVSEHLNGCEDCQALYDVIAEITAALRGYVAPLILGSAAADYLDETGAAEAIESAGPVATRVAAPVAEDDFAGFAVRTSKARGSRRRARRRVPISLGIAAGVTLVALLSGAVAMALNSSPGTSTRGRTAASPPSVPAMVEPPPVVPSSASPQPNPTRVVAHPSPKPSSASPPTTLTTLAASIDVTQQFNQRTSGNTDKVDFNVTNTGSAATGQLTVAIDLPPGSQPTDWSSGGTLLSTSAITIGGFGWNCDPTQSGIACTHDPVPAGQQVDGTFMVDINRACGEPVRMTASSGPVSAKAENNLTC